MWGLWRITEGEEDLRMMAGESCPADVVVPQKRMEFLAGRSLVRTLVEAFGLRYRGITKNPFGKPLLMGLPVEVSLSHSTPYVAAQLHRAKAVGIDVEQPKEKLLRVAPRVLSLEEQLDAGDNVLKHCVYWCAKEALYKIHGERGLHFSTQLLVDPFTLHERGTLRGTIKTNLMSTSIDLGYSAQPTFALAFTL